MVASLLGGLMVFVSAGRAVAETDGLRPAHFDKRHRVDVTQPPWLILGRLQTELGTRCTGFFIAPNVVMTAAHCLWLEESGHYIRPHSVHFLRAYHRGHFAAEARHPHYYRTRLRPDPRHRHRPGRSGDDSS
ncbi:MAG: trypsin-like serine protease [Acetobacteraceae bacterium]